MDSANGFAVAALGVFVVIFGIGAITGLMIWWSNRHD